MEGLTGRLRSPRSAFWVVGSLSLLGVAFALLYAFRTEYQDNPALGRIGEVYRWGRPHAIVGDTNGDGRNDFRGLVTPDTRHFSTSTQIQEWWEDRDFDGIFDLHAVTQPGNTQRVEALELDEDKDGTFETVLRGEAASAYLSERVRSLPRETNDQGASGVPDEL